MNNSINIIRIIAINTLRRKRNIMLMFTIALASLMLVLGHGYVTGVKVQTKELMLNGYTGNATITVSGVTPETGPTPLEVNWNQTLSSDRWSYLSQHYDTDNLVRRIVTKASVMGEDESLANFITLVATEFPKEKNRLFSHLLTFTSGNGKHGAILSENLAKKLGLEVRDTVYFFISGPEGKLHPSMFEVSGIFSAKGYPAIFENLAYINFEELHKWLDLSPDQSSYVIVHDEVDLAAIIKDLAPLNMQVFSATQMGQFFVGIIQGVVLVDRIAAGLMVSMVLLYVLSAVQAMLIGRRTEFGVLTCLGLSRQHISWVILGETAMLMLIPTVVGGLLGIIGIGILSVVGIPALSEGMKYAFASDHLFFHADLSVISTLCLIPLVGIISSLPQTIRCLNTDPVILLGRTDP